MTEADLLCLKSNIDRPVEMETVSGERLTAKILCVFDEEDNAEVFYELISSSTPDFYGRHPDAGGFSLSLKDIVSVKPAA
jgi:hypothetical protein